MAYTKDDQADHVLYTGTGRHAGVVITIWKVASGEHYEVTQPTGQTWDTIVANFEAAPDYLLA